MPQYLTRRLIVFCFALIVSVCLMVDAESTKSELNLKAYSRREMTKRSAPLVAAVNRLKAWRSVVKSAAKVPSASFKRREYEKKGGYLRAIEDFYSVKPDKVQYFHEDRTGAFGTVGHFNDRTIVLQGKITKGIPSKPTLTVYKSEEGTDPDAIYDVISYID